MTGGDQLIVENSPAEAARVGLSPPAELVAHLHARAQREHDRQAAAEPVPDPSPELTDEFYR